jgi:hypothetical protein
MSDRFASTDEQRREIVRGGAATTPDATPIDATRADATRADATRADDAAHHAARDAAHGGTAGTSGKGELSASTAAAGAAGGLMAGLQAGAAAGALTLGVGALTGAVLGAVGGATVGATTEPTGFDADADAHYRGLYEGGHPMGDRRYDDVRTAFVFGHLAAQEPALAGRPFTEVEPELRAAWTDELSRRAGGWEAVRTHVRDAYGHARAEGAGERRRATHLAGSAGSAVDPVELERSLRGEASDGSDARGALPHDRSEAAIRARPAHDASSMHGIDRDPR